MTALAALTGLPLLAVLFLAYVALVLLLARACGLRRVDAEDEGAGGESRHFIVPSKQAWGIEITCLDPDCWCRDPLEAS